MNGSRVARWILALAARLLPRDRRADWIEEWSAELAHEAERLEDAGVTGREQAARLRASAHGAVRDALVLRRIPGARIAPTRRPTMEMIVRETRQALRSLVRSPGLAFAAVLTLALGIGANTAVFSVIDAVLLRPLPFRDPDALVAVRPDQAVSLREIAFLQENARALDDVALMSPGWLMSLTGVADPTQLNATRVSGNLFRLLGMEPVLGRTFGPEEDVPGREPVAVLSHPLWTTRFGGDSNVLGTRMVLDGVPHTIVGVMPPGFEVSWARPDLVTPLPADPNDWTWTSGAGIAVGRLASGANAVAATAELRTLDVRMAELFGTESRDPDPRVDNLGQRIVRDVRTPMLILLGAVAFILLIACANVANLLLVRAMERQQELAVRVALGGSRLDLARVLVLEGMILATLGGIAGMTLAWSGTGLLRGILPPDTPRLASVHVDQGVLLACAAITLVTGLLFSLAPAWFGARGASSAWLRRGRTVASGASRTRGALIAFEIALAVVLAAGAGLMARTLGALYAVDPGFRADRVLTMNIQPSNRDADARRAYMQDVIAALEAAPGVAGAASVLHLPLAGRAWSDEIAIDGRAASDGNPPAADWQAISIGYFDVAGIPLLEGRAFAETDRTGAALVAIVNQAFARTHFPDADAVGQRIRSRSATGGEWATIIGVAGSVRHAAIDQAPRPEMYLPYNQRTVVANNLFIRTTDDPRALAGDLVRRIRAVDPDVPVSSVLTMDEQIDASLGRPRMLLVLLAGFAVLGVTLGAIGISGVVAWIVRQRRREIGIRVALGASPVGVAALVARTGILLAVLGIAIGIPAALGLSRLLRGLVFGVSTTDPITFLAVPFLLLLIAGIAGFVPATRAARVDPAAVLGE